MHLVLFTQCVGGLLLGGAAKLCLRGVHDLYLVILIQVGYKFQYSDTAMENCLGSVVLGTIRVPLKKYLWVI